MKKVLFIVDVPGWAYDNRAKNWQKLLADEFLIDILYLTNQKTLKFDYGMNRLIKEYQTAAINRQNIVPRDLLDSKRFVLEPSKSFFDYKKYDGIVFFYHRAVCDLRLIGTPFPLDKIAICINNEKWMDEGPESTYETYLKGCKLLVGCNNFIIDKFKDLHPKVRRASQAVDDSIFYVSRKQIASNRTGAGFSVGWSGKSNNHLKNFNLVKAACKKAGVRLRTASNLDRKALSRWYNELDAVLCLSKSEGGPALILEAGACAVPVISTPVGLSREIIKHDKNGLIVPEKLTSIVAAIKKLHDNRELRDKFARRYNKEIMENWTYKARLNEIRSVLRELCS